MALTEGRAVGVLGELRRARRDPRGRGDLHLQPHRALPLRGRPGRRRGRWRSACSRARRRSSRPSWSGSLYSLRGGAAAEHLFRVTAGPRLDDHRRGRDPGPGQARLRAGAGRGRDRADPQPPVPRRARRRQAGPHGDRDLGALDVDPLGRRRARPAHARRARGSPGAGRRRRRDRRAHRSRARRQGRRGDLHRQPPLRPRDRPRRALRRPRGALRGAARGARSAPTSSSPRPARLTT